VNSAQRITIAAAKTAKNVIQGAFALARVSMLALARVSMQTTTERTRQLCGQRRVLRYVSAGTFSAAPAAARARTLASLLRAPPHSPLPLFPSPSLGGCTACRHRLKITALQLVRPVLTTTTTTRRHAQGAHQRLQLRGVALGQLLQHAHLLRRRQAAQTAEAAWQAHAVGAARLGRAGDDVSVGRQGGLHCSAQWVGGGFQRWWHVTCSGASSSPLGLEKASTLPSDLYMLTCAPGLQCECALATAPPFPFSSLSHLLDAGDGVDIQALQRGGQLLVVHRSCLVHRLLLAAHGALATDGALHGHGRVGVGAGGRARLHPPAIKSLAVGTGTPRHATTQTRGNPRRCKSKHHVCLSTRAVVHARCTPPTGKAMLEMCNLIGPGHNRATSEISAARGAAKDANSPHHQTCFAASHCTEGWHGGGVGREFGPTRHRHGVARSNCGWRTRLGTCHRNTRPSAARNRHTPQLNAENPPRGQLLLINGCGCRGRNGRRRGLRRRLRHDATSTAGCEPAEIYNHARGCRI